jgi:hypothetical protein
VINNTRTPAKHLTILNVNFLLQGATIQLFNAGSLTTCLFLPDYLFFINRFIAVNDHKLSIYCMKFSRQILLILSTAIVFLACRKEKINPIPEITQWGLAGSAVFGTDKPPMAPQPDGSWSITWPLYKGALRFTAGQDRLSYGGDNRGMLDTAGADIRIDSAANYTLTVRPSARGQYTYSIERLRFP